MRFDMSSAKTRSWPGKCASASVSAGLIATASVLAAARAEVQPVGVTVQPPSASLRPSETRQFHGTVTGTRDQRVGWLVNGIRGGAPASASSRQAAATRHRPMCQRLALVFDSLTLALCLLFLTGLLENLPKAVLAAVVLVAVFGLFDFPALSRMWRASRLTSALHRVTIPCLGSALRN
jgi:hypothetical protein